LIDSRGKTYGFQYDTDQREVRTTNPLGHVLVLQFDPQDNLVALTDESGNVSHYRYDPLNRMVSITQPNGDAITFQHDSTGKVKSIQNARGQTIAYEYDRDGFVTRKTLPGKAAASYRIGLEAELTQMTDAGGSTNFQYDAAGRVSGIQYPNELKAGCTYDPNGNLVTIEYPGNQIVRYSYDLRNRPIRVEWGQHFIACQYDPAGNLIGITRSNGVESAYTYNPNRLVTGVKHNRDGQILADIRYTLDAASNLTAESGSYPLEPVLTEPASQAVYNSVNQLTSLNGQPYRYDADGNLESIGAMWQASYDPENRITELHRNGETLSHSYDGNGRLSAIIKEGNVRHFYYDPFGRLLFETDGQNQLSQMVVYLGNRLAALVQPDGQPWFYHFNAQGSTLALTNPDGEMIAAYAYNPYGACTSKAGSITGNPFTFVGEFGVLDEGEGLYFMKNRHYDAFSGRFLQQDPIGISGGTNLYAYTAGNPTSRIDPEGTFVFLAVLGVVAAVGVIIYESKDAVSSAFSSVKAGLAHAFDRQNDINVITSNAPGVGEYEALKRFETHNASSGADIVEAVQKTGEAAKVVLTEGAKAVAMSGAGNLVHGGEVIMTGNHAYQIYEHMSRDGQASSTADIGTPPPITCPPQIK